MFKEDNQIFYSASDFTKFIDCKYASFVDHQSLEKSIKKTETSYTLKIYQDRGKKFELEYLNKIKKEFKNVVEIEGKNINIKLEKTIDAMKAGADVIYQAAFKLDNLIGYADFLVRTDVPSKLGGYSYEILDTKSSTKQRAKFLLQLSFYNELLSKIQGKDPKFTYLVMGDGSKHTYVVSEYIHYYRKNKQKFISFINGDMKDLYPEKCSFCDLCDWRDLCKKKWEEDNYINQVAGIRVDQVNKLKKIGINTLDQLSKINLQNNKSEIYPKTLQRLISQASLQQYKLNTGENKFEILELANSKGFNRMPQPNEYDLYFDIEGDPYFEERRLEYLFGIYFKENENFIFKTFWSNDHIEEKKNFEGLMNFIWGHLKKYPDANIYHYGNYEVDTLKRLSTFYAKFEAELDNLLRREKFRDLYVISRESIRVSEPSYSIKNLETFYMESRSQAIQTGSESIEIFHLWLETKEKSYREEIEEYNKIDCISTHDLHKWLLNLRPKGADWFINDYSKNSEDLDVTVKKDWEIEFENYKEKLINLSVKSEDKLPITLINILEYHNRNQKSEWWKQFDRQNKFPEELIDDNECIAIMKQVEDPVSDKRSLIYTFEYPEQDHKFKKDTDVADLTDLKFGGTVLDVDSENRVIKLKLGKAKLLDSEISIGPHVVGRDGPLRRAIYKYANNYLENKKYSAINDLINKSKPKIKIKKEKLITNYDNIEIELLEILDSLDNSYLFIQGPPGSGKTYLTAKVIIDLIKRGKCIGVTSNSHNAVHVLLKQIEDQSLKENFKFNGVKKFTKDENKYEGNFIENLRSTEGIDMSKFQLVAGTAWLFAHDHLDQKIDYLFIDEAGQVPLANAIAAGTAANNIVLVGDPNQLANVNQGSHPGSSGLSSVEYILGDEKTIQPTNGIFLEKTRRLNSHICKFISEAFYDGRLSSFEQNDNRKILFKKPIFDIKSQGIHTIYSEHIGCSQKSIEEGKVIKELFNFFLEQNAYDIKNNEKKITVDDILVVTPFNVQVNYLQSILPENARVGTIDKFQGQESMIVITSMVSSSAEDMPRNIDFLFSKNRLNVALSRAQCLAIMVINPNLLEIPCSQISDMKSVNNFCWLEKFN